MAVGAPWRIVVSWSQRRVRLCVVEEPEGCSEIAGRREAAKKLIGAHGEFMYRYCLAMLGEHGLRAVLPDVFRHIEESLVEITTSIEEPSAGLALYAVVHNRCIEYSRGGAWRSGGNDSDGDEGAAIDALAELRPVGRGVVVLRSVLGLSWEEMERVCGMPRWRLRKRVCRAWRRIAQLVETEDKPKVMSTKYDHPRGAPLGEDIEMWRKIRADAHGFMLLRAALRQAYLQLPPDDWCAQIWESVDRQQNDVRQHTQQQQEEDVIRELLPERAKPSCDVESMPRPGPVEDESAANIGESGVVVSSESPAASPDVSRPKGTRQTEFSHPKVMLHRFFSRSMLIFAVLLVALIFTIYQFTQ